MFALHYCLGPDLHPVESCTLAVAKERLEISG